MEINIWGKYLLLIDDEDYDLVKDYSWAIVRKRKDGLPYVYLRRQRNKKSVSFAIHRFLLKITNPKIQVDHIDGNTLNNQKSNLRTVTNQLNSFNSSGYKNRLCKYKGITFCKKRKKYVASIRKDGTGYYLGGYLTDLEAALAYDLKATELFGEYARTNKRLGLL